MEIKRIAFDTSAYTALKQGNQEIMDILERADDVYLSPVVVGELLFGFKNGTKLSWNKDLLDKFIDRGVMVSRFSSETSDIYSDIIYDLKKKGRPIPTNDVWIAAQSMEQGSVLLTLDKHFKQIDGLRMILF